jgi:hypothetical protein
VEGSKLCFFSVIMPATPPSPEVDAGKLPQVIVDIFKFLLRK